MIIVINTFSITGFKQQLNNLFCRFTPQTMVDHTRQTRQHQLHLLLLWQVLVRDPCQVGHY